MDFAQVKGLVDSVVLVRMSNPDEDAEPRMFAATLVRAGETASLVDFPRVPDGLIRDPNDPLPVSDEEDEALLKKQFQAEGRVWVLNTRISKQEI